MTRIMRSLLYVPANSWRMINTATTEGADAVILDLEDGCPMAEKEMARIFARDSIPMLKEHCGDVFVRVNSLETGLTATDISYVSVEGLDGIMLAKTESSEDIAAVDELLQEEEREKGLEPKGITLIALLETPKGILNLREIIGASQRVIALGFGAGDFSREMGAGMGVTKLSPEEYFPMVLHARSSIAMAARAAGIQAIDTPFFGLLIDLEGLATESGKVKLLGFSGKQLTHPRHVPVVNAVFSPAEEEVDFAKRVVGAYEEAKAKGLGATSLGGRMIDYGTFKRAESLLALAEAIEKKDRKKGEE
jgi:citrate lyase subunit beta/citryl-CoA lyase